MSQFIHGNLVITGSAGDWSAHYEAVTYKDLNRLHSCPHCGLTNTLEICNTHTASYWVECECGAKYHAAAVEVPRRASRETVIECHRIALDRAISGWNRRSL
jgi:hypothetical protein